MTDVIAHRGASSLRPENTIDAFVAARDMGADGVEFDVRRTLDGEAVVRHDEVLADGRPIWELVLAEVPRDVPRLDEAIDACSDLTINVEIKNVRVDADFDPDQVLAHRVVSAVDRAGCAERVIVSSFGFAAIDRVRDLAPTLRTAWLLTDRGEAAALIERAANAGHRGVHPRWPMVDEAFMNRAHDAGLFVNVWTVNDPETIRRLGDLGVDGVVTDVPDVALVALGRAGGDGVSDRRAGD